MPITLPCLRYNSFKGSGLLMLMRGYITSSSAELKHRKEKMALKLSTNYPNATEMAVNFLKAGQVIAIPTDTVYGLACCATNSSAILELYKVKDRDKNKPLAICLSNISDIQKWAQTEHLPGDLLKLLLPGPVTLLLKINNKSKLHSSLFMEEKIGIRIPDYKFIRDVAEDLRWPIALTSANISGQPSPVRTEEFEELWGSIACVFDGGTLGKEDNNINSENASTIIDLSKPGHYTILRAGVAEENVCHILKSFNLKCNLT